MAIGTTWTSPAEGGGLDLATGGTVTETIWEEVMSNINRLGGADGDCKTGRFIIGGTANTLNAAGLTINQGAADDEIISLKSSDVAHGMTASTETDTYGMLKKIAATGGGLAVVGYSDPDGVAGQGLLLKGVAGVAASTVKSAAGIGVIDINAAVKDGTGTADPGADANLLSIRGGVSGNAKFLFDIEGDSFEDGTGWTAYDGHNDLALLELVNAVFVRAQGSGDAIKTEFWAWVGEHAAMLQELKLIYFNADGRHFINRSKMQELLVGAMRQMGAAMSRTEQRLALMEQRLAMLPEPRT